MLAQQVPTWVRPIGTGLIIRRICGINSTPETNRYIEFLPDYLTSNFVQQDMMNPVLPDQDLLLHGFLGPHVT